MEASDAEDVDTIADASDVLRRSCGTRRGPAG
jgi:hypothetical protein